MNVTPSIDPVRATAAFPDGWFALCASDEIRRGAVVATRVMGRDVVAYRTQSGEARVCDPYCPHLGAHLGHGGRVDGEELVCPFHAFAYDKQGACVRTGCGERPPHVSLRQWPVRERNGLLYVWHHHAGTAPEWEPPVLDLPGYVSHRFGTLKWHGYWDDLVENIADTSHMRFVHRLPAWQMSEQAADGHRFNAVVKATYFGNVEVRMRVVFHGPGIMVAEGETMGLDYKLIATLTPVDAFSNRFLHSEAVRMTAPRMLPALLRRSIARALVGFLHRFHVVQVNRDTAIWNHRSRLERPNLCAIDAPIVLCRRWARQFVPSGGPADMPMDEPVARRQRAAPAKSAIES
ncbi:Rieske 2Fe-2S domain-containing protein [Burkholderia multivorans]|uniref:Rieske 2Fe-2S domain-containing protein n=1 Tax=Burkholderia multivorans TaxID=87883 RepID=UPI0019D07145|nr:Rieske 2Fe-2S domain-containing protein [Burkholderia multivorans]MBN6732894.1 Rieske (2Fe-2S) protein [Burkholderia multivorans]MBN6738436.1 Rieske (2Fe-2S) protein [Burkholderia multivorans]MBN7125135.1 Rieske (2Fe-2S) protein [Burkholderia multivorans]MBN8167197.1 Rieske (2Fe-2S) protein [Burkholderia multivorans]MBN8172990.1 Rieske (2Fe-2S) protein [Burkholderia multivorans]